MGSLTNEMSRLSSLTTVQMETLRAQHSVRKGEINLSSALKMRKNSGISRGTHYRILAQARKNLRESLFTVATAVQLGLIKPEDVQKLVVTVSLVPAEMDEDKLSEVMTLLTALIDRIVTS